MSDQGGVGAPTDATGRFTIRVKREETPAAPDTVRGWVLAAKELELPLEEGDTLGIGTLRSDGCPFEPFPLRFVEGEPLSWPFP
jgi:hypothetical protein